MYFTSVLFCRLIIQTYSSFLFSTILFFHYKTSSTCGAGQYKTTKTFNYKGSGGCSSNSPCNTCEGDCDKDSHCQGNLKCFQRDDEESVPGCSGGIDKSGKDFCYDPDG